MLISWFKCLDPQSPVFFPIVSAVGKGGAFEVLCVISEALKQQVNEIDLEMTKKWAGVKRDRAEKILPFAQDFLQETLKIYGKTSEIQKKSQEILPKSLDFEGQNPHGSTHAHAGAEREREISNLDIKKDLSLSNESDEEKKLAKDGIEHFIRCGNPNYSKFDWIPAYLIRQWRYIQISKPEMDVHQFFNEWCSACEASTQKGAGSHKYYAKTFEGNLNKWTPQTTPTLKLVGPSRAQKLMAAKKIRHIWEHDIVIATEQIQCGNLGDMYFNGLVIDATLYEPIEETA